MTMRMDKGKPFMHVEEDGGSAPTFSEAFLYDTVGKGDARFILGVAEEYEHIIEALGPAAVRAVLDVRPRLAQRLRIGNLLLLHLEDARSPQSLDFDRTYPPQVVLDDDAAGVCWDLLHKEYSRYYNPEESMDGDQLRTYHALTDALGHWHREQRRKEQERLPEKLEKQRVKREQIAARRAAARAS